MIYCLFVQTNKLKMFRVDAYAKIVPAGSKSPNDDVWVDHVIVCTKSKAHPACCADCQLECNVSSSVIEAPLQADLCGHGDRVRQVVVCGPCRFSPGQGDEEEREQSRHDASARLESFWLRTISAELHPPTLSGNTPALLDELRWYLWGGGKVPSNLEFDLVECRNHHTAPFVLPNTSVCVCVCFVIWLKFKEFSCVSWCPIWKFVVSELWNDDSSCVNSATLFNPFTHSEPVFVSLCEILPSRPMTWQICTITSSFRLLTDC